MSIPTTAIRFYGFPLSGHSHRVELFLHLVGLPFENITMDLAGGAQKRPEFLRMNPFGQVPVIVDGEVTLADSNAILVYLATRYGGGKWLPADALGMAQVQRWLSVAAGLVAFGPAAARLVTVFKQDFRHEEVIGRAHRLLKVMEGELQGRSWLVGGVQGSTTSAGSVQGSPAGAGNVQGSPAGAGEGPTIADIANYSYIAHAPEGGVSLQEYPNVRAWLARIEALPGFVGMPRTAIGLAA